MAFIVQDFHDLVQLLEQHPEWRVELRRLVLSEELLSLPALVRDLVEAQRRSEERLTRTEAGLTDLREAVGDLAVSQAAMERTVSEMRRELRGLATTVGATVEEEAEAYLLDTLKQKGYRVEAGPFNVPLDGEVDVAVEVVDREERRFWAIVEAKARLSARAVEDWANRMRSDGVRARLKAAGIPGPYLVYAFGMRLYPDTAPAAVTVGIGLLTGRGE